MQHTTGTINNAHVIPFFAALLLAGLLGCAPGSPRVISPDFTAENGSNALRRTVEFVKAHSPRNPGTPEAKKAAHAIHLDLTTVPGISFVRMVPFQSPTPEGIKTFHNVLGEIKGTGDEWIVLLTHYDTKSGIAADFQGANDGGSSTGLMLELARVLAAAPRLKHNILIAFLDGEECHYAYTPTDGLHGSRHLAVSLKQQGRRISAVILADMIGDQNFQLQVPPNTTPRLRKLLHQTARESNLQSYVRDVTFEILDDHQPFLDLGYPAIDLIDFDYGPKNVHWHTPADTIDKLHPTGYIVTGQLICGLIRHLERK